MSYGLLSASRNESDAFKHTPHSHWERNNMLGSGDRHRSVWWMDAIVMWTVETSTSKPAQLIYGIVCLCLKPGRRTTHAWQRRLIAPKVKSGVAETRSSVPHQSAVHDPTTAVRVINEVRIVIPMVL